MVHIHDSGTVSCFCDEMRAPFDGTLPEISVYFANKQAMNDAITLLIANSYLPASTMQREGSSKREVVSSKYSARDLVKLIESGRHILLKKAFGLPDIGLGVLEESVRIDFVQGLNGATLRSTDSLRHFGFYGVRCPWPIFALMKWKSISQEMQLRVFRNFWKLSIPKIRNVLSEIHKWIY